MTAAVSPLDGSLFGPQNPCFGCSPTNPAGLHLHFTLEGEDVVTQVVPQPHHQGPLGLMHGGLIATLADETAAWTVLARLGKFGFTTHFESRLSRGVKIGVPTVARGRLTRTSSRVVKAAVEISQDGATCFTGDFTFVVLDQQAAEKMMGTPLPEAWLRYCR